MLGPLALLATAACLATPVSADRSRVHAGPFVGALSRGFDDVGGRFSLRVGGMRTDTLSSKIPWFLSRRYTTHSGELVVRGRQLDGTGTFVQRFQEAYSPSTPRQHTYPSIIDPPAEGCWRLTFAVGKVKGALTMLARPPYGG